MKINPLIIPQLNEGDALSIESELRASVELKELGLYSMMAFHLGWTTAEMQEESLLPPSRLHAQLALAVCIASGADAAIAFCPASAVELMSSFFEIHEDVQDGNTERRNRPAVWWTWGPAQAINAGNGMHSIARLKLFESNATPSSLSKMAQILDAAALERCEAAFEETKHQEKLITSTERYLEFAKGRAGSLFGAAAALGLISARQGETPDELCSSLLNFGRSIGAARQIAEDIRLMWESEEGPSRTKTAQARAMNKKTNLPLAYTLSVSPPKSKMRIGEIYMARVLSQDALKEVAAFAEDVGAKEFCRDTLTHLKGEACEIINDAHEFSSENKTALKEAVEWLTSNI